jgi:hypothetical protein
LRDFTQKRLGLWAQSAELDLFAHGPVKSRKSVVIVGNLNEEALERNSEDDMGPLDRDHLLDQHARVNEYQPAK